MTNDDAEPISDGSELGVVEVGLTAFQVALRARGALPLFVTFAILTVGGLSLLDADGAIGGLAFASALVGLLGIIAVLGFTFVFAPAAYYQRRLAERFPDARVITTESGLWLGDATRVLLTARVPPNQVSGDQVSGGTKPAARARLYSYLLLSTEGISFWSRDDVVLRPFLAIPRSRIRGITNGFSNPRASSQTSFAMIHIRKDDGDDYPLSFTPQAPRFQGVMKTVVWQETIVKWMTEQYH